MLSTRGGDAVRIALARRDLRGATWPALAGTLCAEGSFETVFGLAVTLVADRLGVGTAHAPPPALIGGVVAAALLLVVIAARSDRGRRLLREVGRGLAILRQPRRWASRVLPWQAASRLLRVRAGAGVPLSLYPS